MTTAFIFMTISYFFFSDENMNMDEKAMLVTNDNFNMMILDERNPSRIKLNKQPDRTLSSFLHESQFYENLQIVRWVLIAFSDCSVSTQLSTSSLTRPRKQPDDRSEIISGQEEIHTQVNHREFRV